VRRLLALSALALVGLTAGCGDPAPSAEEEVRSVLATFATATERRDYATICDEVFAPRLL